MVLLLNYRARGAPSLGPTPPRRPITALTGCPPPRAAPGDVPGAKGSPTRQYFPIQPVFRPPRKRKKTPQGSARRPLVRAASAPPRVGRAEQASPGGRRKPAEQRRRRRVTLTLTLFTLPPQRSLPGSQKWTRVITGINYHYRELPSELPQS